ncbi:hypothetical protein [Microbacterium oxydans]|uniref:hypothetical protein n=1 Tax=Microbacterium oxydans TaxID=82380 RepID=UPI00366C9EFA
MSARHNGPKTMKQHAENAVDHADSAARVMNDAELPDFRDRAFEELSFAVLELGRALVKLAESKSL